MQPFLVISALVTTYLCYVEGPCRMERARNFILSRLRNHDRHHDVNESSCTTPGGSPGQCKLLTECAPLTALVNKPDRTQADTEVLKKSHCGFEGKRVKVCCPESCYTPDGKEGQCMSIHSCSHLVQQLRPGPNSKVPEHILNFVQNSRCDGPDQYSVCCGPAFDTLAPPVPGQCSASALPPAPSTECCGSDGVTGNKIYGGNETGIDQYPWLSLIEYKQGNKIKLLCGASLISARYVLTAGHCVAGDVLNYGTPVNIRLGEHDTNNDGIDCVDVDGGGKDCNQGTTIIPIERTIPHPDYNPYHSQKRHDIALIRLRNLAPYTEFIRPICLPATDFSVLPPPAKPYKFFAAGWGAVSNTTSKSNVKLHVQLPYVATSMCQSAYQQPKRNVALWDGQLCAGGEVNKDSCKGDSGGPLMYENGKIYEVIGVVSFGPIPCGLANIPGVYTKVYHYIPWMRSVMRP